MTKKMNGISRFLYGALCIADAVIILALALMPLIKNPPAILRSAERISMIIGVLLIIMLYLIDIRNPVFKPQYLRENDPTLYFLHRLVFHWVVGIYFVALAIAIFNGPIIG